MKVRVTEPPAGTVQVPLLHDSSLGTVADGGLTKLGAGTLTLTATNTYTGETIVTAGTLTLSAAALISNSKVIFVSSGATLDASALNGGVLALANGQKLTGDGTIRGNLTVASGAILVPVGSLTSLTFDNNLSLSGGSMTMMEVSKSPVTTNDVVQVAGTLTYGGTLVITNVGARSLSAGDNFKLFDASIFSGAFKNIIPATPGTGLSWNTVGLTNGVLSVVAAASPIIRNIGLVNGNFEVAGNGGSPNAGYYVMTSTNLILPLTNWTIISTDSFDADGNFTFTNAANPNQPQQFFIIQQQ